MHVVISLLPVQHVDSYYAAAKRGTHFPVKFEEDEISLDIPDATVVEGGWEITPLAPPLVCMFMSVFTSTCSLFLFTCILYRSQKSRWTAVRMAN